MKVRVAGLIIKKEKVLLLHYNYDGTDVYTLPGGNLEFGEEMRACLQRELEEELSIKTKIGEEPLMSGEIHLNGKDTLHVIYLTELVDGNLKINPSETTARDFVWHGLNDLDRINLYPNVASSIQDWKSGKLEDSFLGTINQKWF